jgi:hypothetical protein
MQEMTPDEATVALYKCIYHNERNTTLEDVQRYVEAGARLRDIETRYGPPLLWALCNMCSPPILKYLIEKGGIDWTYKKGRYISYSEDEPWFYIDCITYHTYKNELIRTWHFYRLTYKDINQELINMFKIHNIPEHRYKKHLATIPSKDDEESYYSYTCLCNTRKQLCGEGYLEQMCELFGVTPDELENGILDLPDKMFDMSLLPKEDKPYCWNHSMDNPHIKMRGFFAFAELKIEKIYKEYSDELEKSYEGYESDESDESEQKESNEKESPYKCTISTSNV